MQQLLYCRVSNYNDKVNATSLPAYCDAVARAPYRSRPEDAMIKISSESECKHAHAVASTKKAFYDAVDQLPKGRSTKSRKHGCTLPSVQCIGTPAAVPSFDSGLTLPAAHSD